MADENITGKRIKDLCRQKGITVRELAEKSNTTEVSMSRFITGARMPNAPVCGRCKYENFPKSQYPCRKCTWCYPDDREDYWRPKGGGSDGHDQDP